MIYKEGNTLNPFVSTFIYWAIGMVLFIVGYKLFDFITPFNLNEEIDNHNIGAGLVVGGLFIAIAIVVSAAMI